MRVACTVNGRKVDLSGAPMDRLLDLVREQLGLTGTKEGCGEGECGACTVLMDGEPVLSCLVPLVQCAGRTVRTVEDIGDDPKARAFLEKFVEMGGAQCGACTPGIIMTAWCAAQKGPLDRERIHTALAGNLCRCTGYEAIVRALGGDAP